MKVSDLPDAEYFNCPTWNAFLLEFDRIGGPPISRNPEVLAFWVCLGNMAFDHSERTAAENEYDGDECDEDAETYESSLIDAEERAVSDDDLDTDRDYWQYNGPDGEGSEGSIAFDSEGGVYDEDVGQENKGEDRADGDLVADDSHSASEDDLQLRLVQAPYDVDWSTLKQIQLWDATWNAKDSAASLDVDDISF